MCGTECLEHGVKLLEEWVLGVFIYLREGLVKCREEMGVVYLQLLFHILDEQGPQLFVIVLQLVETLAKDKEHALMVRGFLLPVLQEHRLVHFGELLPKVLSGEGTVV